MKVYKDKKKNYLIKDKQPISIFEIIPDKNNNVYIMNPIIISSIIIISIIFLLLLNRNPIKINKYKIIK
jgi:hypothetical protein